MIRFRPRRGAIAALIVLLVPLAAATAASAPGEDRPRDQAAAPADVGVAVSAGAPNARLAALVDAGGAVIRRKGVQSLARIDVGVYCIRPWSNTGINPNTAVVIVSPDYFYSELDEVTVQWASTQNGCGTGRLGVYTFADADGDSNYTFSNQVGFSVYVP